MKRTLSAALVGGSLLFFAGCGGEGSTPEQCDTACRRWDTCEGSPGWYPYATCYQDCEQEGDWDDTYVGCLGQYSTCVDMERNCG